MYCSGCGAQVAAGLSFCNRCGTNLKSAESKTATISAFLTAIALVAFAGFGIMLGGGLVLKKQADLPSDLIGAFMFMVFLLVLIIELFLCRQLSRVTSGTDKRAAQLPAQQLTVEELNAAQRPLLAEPVSSVTENTTRTLEYSRPQSLER